MSEIATVEHLTEILGEPLPRVRSKDRDTLAPEQIAWLSASPFWLVATSALDGTCDVSPKGDPAGAVVVLDDRTIAFAERPGNRRADGFRNLLQNPQIGLLFVIPGRGDTLRVNGRARLLTDAPYGDRLVANGHRPDVICEVAVEQVFFHCSKAFLRSQLWEPESWAPEAVPSRAVIAKALERPEESIEDLERYYGAGYRDSLY